MKCPYCKEELGLNNICINPMCSYFGTTIKSSEKSHLNDTENNLDTNLNSRYYDENDYTSDQGMNKTANKYFNDNISTEEFAAFIGSHNTYYYLDHIHKKNNKFLSWNWSCFFLGPYWLLYRKLYAFAAILIVLTTGFSLLIHSAVPKLIILTIRIVLAMFANTVYLNNSERKIRSIKATISNLSTTQYINRLHKKGGVNLVAPLVILVIYTVFILIVFLSVFLFSTSHTPHNFSAPSYNY